MMMPVVITSGPIYRAHPLGIDVLGLTWISLRSVEGYKIPVPDLFPCVAWLPCGKEGRRLGKGKSKAVGT